MKYCIVIHFEGCKELAIILKLSASDDILEIQEIN
jgi:hypothetical protein